MAIAPCLSLSIQEGNSCRWGEMFDKDKTSTVQSHSQRQGTSTSFVNISPTMDPVKTSHSYSRQEYISPVN